VRSRRDCFVAARLAMTITLRSDNYAARLAVTIMRLNRFARATRFAGVIVQDRLFVRWGLVGRVGWRIYLVLGIMIPHRADLVTAQQTETHDENCCC
jgi:hypothetical protein